MTDLKRWSLVQLDEVPPATCPCGASRRAFVGLPGNHAGTLHLVDIRADSRVHYHRTISEIYLVLAGEGHLELDGERVPVRPMTAVFIKPWVRHRAVGRLQVAVIPMPGHDGDDEWFDD